MSLFLQSEIHGSLGERKDTYERNLLAQNSDCKIQEIDGLVQPMYGYDCDKPYKTKNTPVACKLLLIMEGSRTC